MNNTAVTFANPLGEFFSPLLLFMRSIGFFEAYVFLPVMTTFAVAIFVWLKKSMAVNETFNHPVRQRYRYVILPLYFMMCFFFTGGTAVAFKTMILQEMDYTEAHWYIPYVSHLHFYIVSVALAYIYLIGTYQSTHVSRLLCVYVQFGFLGAYAIATHRIFNEPWVISDPASGLSGFYMYAIFGILNIDILFRFFQREATSAPLVSTILAVEKNV